MLAVRYHAEGLRLRPCRRQCLIAVLLVGVGLSFAVAWLHASRAVPIRVGVLHSLTGTMALSERPLVDAVRLGVEQVNREGGLLGRPLEMVVADGASDPARFASEAERLLGREQVDVLFACWTSACRSAVRPVVERHQGLMVYPVQYEGLESSPNILYTGSAPNQQIIPGARWAMRQFGRRVFLVGSDYIFPHTANLMIRDLAAAGNGVVVGERYVPLGSRELGDVVEEIRRSRPDVVLNTLNGDSNSVFFESMVNAGLADQPMVSFSLAEEEMRAWGGSRLRSHYGVWSYFQSLETPANRAFVAAFRARFGAERATSDPVEAAYAGLRLWAQAVREEGSAAPRRVNVALLRQSIPGPSGPETVDAATRHLWKMVRVGKVRPDGQFEQVFASSVPLRPAPWPVYRSRAAWERLVADELGAGQ